MTQDQECRANNVHIISRGRQSLDDCIEFVLETDYQRMQRLQCDPPWTMASFVAACLIVICWLGGVAILEGSL